jgi:hypothetical protein
MSNAARRQHWTGAITHGRPDEADDDALFWVGVPIDERAQLTWDLSAELYALARLNRGVFDEETGAFVAVDEGSLERRLPRAAFRISRR